jgi:small subunit ribosomal protein S8
MRNAIKAKHTKVDIPYSRLKEDITKILLEYRYIQSYLKIDDNKQGLLRIYLKYDEQENSVINTLQKVTRPGLKKYVRANEIPRVLNNLGIAILSTSKGVITDRQARQFGVGGEVLCYIW